jgi:hypothetical protein
MHFVITRSADGRVGPVLTVAYAGVSIETLGLVVASTSAAPG